MQIRNYDPETNAVLHENAFLASLIMSNGQAIQDASEWEAVAKRNMRRKRIACIVLIATTVLFAMLPLICRI